MWRPTPAPSDELKRPPQGGGTGAETVDLVPVSLACCVSSGSSVGVASVSLAFRSSQGLMPPHVDGIKPLLFNELNVSHVLRNSPVQRHARRLILLGATPTERTPGWDPCRLQIISFGSGEAWGLAGWMGLLVPWEGPEGSASGRAGRWGLGYSPLGPHRWPNCSPGGTSYSHTD